MMLKLSDFVFYRFKAPEAVQIKCMYAINADLSGIKKN